MHTCQVRRGLAHCECHTGFLLAADRRSCEGKVPSPCTSPTLGPAVGGPGPSRCCTRPWSGDGGTGTHSRSASLLSAEAGGLRLCFQEFLC